MSFQFSLSAVLRVREGIEKHEERTLQTIQLAVVRTSRQIEELSARISDSHYARVKALEQTISGAHLHALLWEEKGAEQQLRALLAQMQVLEQERAKQMKVYQAAHQDRQMLTDMQKRQRERYDREWLREEQKRLDDIFVARRHRVL